MKTKDKTNQCDEHTNTHARKRSCKEPTNVTQ